MTTKNRERKQERPTCDPLPPGLAAPAEEPTGDVLKLAGLAAAAGKMKAVTGGSPATVAAEWVAAQYLLALGQRLAALPPDSPERFQLLQAAAEDVAKLQRGGVLAARLQLEREKLEFQRQRHQDKIEAANRPPPPPLDPNRPWTDEETKSLLDKVDEVFGLKPRHRRPPKKVVRAKRVKPVPVNVPDPIPGTYGMAA